MKSPSHGGLCLILSCMAFVGHACGEFGRYQYQRRQDEEAEEEDDFHTSNIRTIVRHLAKQVQLQQFAMEEMTRTGGGSGLKQQRNQVAGSRSYNTESHTGFKIAAFHDHANHRNTVGMGESVFVLNGVEFRTRHNDYPLYQPHRTSGEYNAVQELEFPDVPPSVLEKKTVEEQIKEMQKWFTAWSSQDYSDPNYDYRKYFKAALCYLEGGWTAQANKLEEAFFSDRHFIDADSWEDLNVKVRYNTFMGRKNAEENFAYLPRTIINITDRGIPMYAQWNYRILCHPLKDDLPVATLVQEDDVAARISHRRKTLKDWAGLRGARFRIEGIRENRLAPYTLLDELMEQIPGKNNYQGFLTETTMGERYTMPLNDTKLLNVAYYNRRYALAKKDASGLKGGKRGFSDPTLFLAENTQPKMAAVYARMCESRGEHTCWEALKRVTYAIPIEIVYMTPLHNWNPYNIKYVANARSRENTDDGKRNGGFTKETAYKATDSKLYYRTPVEFFNTGKPQVTSAADTALAKLGMLDGDGELRNVTATGFRVFLPEIEGIGFLRTRYPVMPIHGEGSGVWKELNAIKAMVLRLKSYQDYMYEKLPTTTTTSSTSSSSSSSSSSSRKKKAATLLYLTFKMYPSADAEMAHHHIINVSAAQRTDIMRGKEVPVVSDVTEGHSHKVKMSIDSGRFFAVTIDGKKPPVNGHSDRLEWQTIVTSDGKTKIRGQRRKRWADDDLGTRRSLADEDDMADFCEPLADNCVM